jgi:hypothetical protein
MTSTDLKLILDYLSRVPVRGFQDEDDLVKLMDKVRTQIVRTNKSTKVYTDQGSKVA